MPRAMREWRAARLFNSAALILALFLIVESISVWSVILGNEEQFGFRDDFSSFGSDEIPSSVIFPFQMKHETCLMLPAFKRKLVQDTTNYLQRNVNAHLSGLLGFSGSSVEGGRVSGIMLGKSDCRIGGRRHYPSAPRIFYSTQRKHL